MPVLDRGNAEVYYEHKGEGPAIVFAHGAGGNAAIWFNQVAHFSPEYTCVAFDHRCFARSPCNVDLSVHDFRDDLLAIMDAVGINSAHLVGQSMGGFTVLRTALDAPDRVTSLTLSCTSGGIYNPEPSEALGSLTTSSGRDTGGVLSSMSKASAEKPELMQLYESINSFNTEFGWEKLRTMLGRDDVVHWEGLAGVKCPALIISGAEDPLFPPDQLAQFVPHFANGRIEIVEDAGHSPYFEQPDIFNALLKAHIEAV